jgi:hypothetical protein
MSHYTSLPSQEIFLTRKDCRALRWLYDQVGETDRRGIQALVRLAPGDEITLALYYQVHSLLSTIDSSMFDQWFGQHSHLRQWCCQKSQYLSYMN